MNELKVGFVGLGAMGLPMAGHLARAGFLCAVWNRTHDKAVAASQVLGVAAPATIAELAPLCNVIALCVP
ncbi:MAG: NAD(P)-binding domain-containing protein, partial [Dokdonella sp.]